MKLLTKLNRPRLTALTDKFVQQIADEQQRRTVARKKAQIKKALKKG